MPHLFATLLLETSFFELVSALLLVGLLEHLLHRLPAAVVGPGGWLVDTRARSA